MTENEMVGWLHRLNGREFEQASGDGERQGSLACRSPCDRKESDIAEQLNDNNTYEHKVKLFKNKDCFLLS